jgi:sec-independent protein translocase protein TatC
MTFLEHLEELRRRLVRSAIAVGIGFAIALTWAKPIFAWLARPLDGILPEGARSLVYLHPVDPFMLYMKVGLLAGIFLSSPAVLWQVWAFISPGLYPRERKMAAPFLFFTVSLFVLGGWFGYSWAYPAALKFLIGEMGQGFHSGITIDNYFDMTAKIILALGAVFEIPVLIFFLARFGIVTPGWLLRKFRYAVLVIAILAAVLTPTPDMFNMLMFMAPMILLYLLGILVAWLFGGKRDRAAP